jgi:hypothetical protein
MIAREHVHPFGAQPPGQQEVATDAVRRTFHLLGRASDNWRNGSQYAEGPLHWPVSVHLARHALRRALQALEDDAP